MIQGLYTAAGGMLAVEKRQEAIANNIANAATPGYKRAQPVQLGFYQVFQTAMRRPAWHRADTAPSGGVKLVDTYPSLQSGILQDTGNDMNLALQGPGFFVVDTPAGERYTRAGSFTIDPDGHLATGDGFKVQSASGQPLAIGSGSFNVGEDGTITVDGEPAGRIRMVEFAQPYRLQHEGGNLLRASQEVEQQRAESADTRLVQGRLEMSNVSLPQEMGGMMLGLRAYEANQRVITTIDETMGRLIDQVGMPT
ncbi:MAG: flagellar basal-body rod protein FlgF [Candidatus Hydrogenedens sp.]|nr:flagellar basal-body rod protein FlgF [Candidatus Hydrogenedens sp.]